MVYFGSIASDFADVPLAGAASALSRASVCASAAVVANSTRTKLASSLRSGGDMMFCFVRVSHKGTERGHKDTKRTRHFFVPLCLHFVPCVKLPWLKIFSASKPGRHPALVGVKEVSIRRSDV